MCRPDACNFDKYLTGFSELDGVADQVDKYLFQAHRVSYKGIRHIRRSADIHFNSLCRCLLSEHVRQLIQNIVQFKTCSFGDKFSSFKLGKIKNIIKHSKEGAG